MGADPIVLRAALRGVHVRFVRQNCAGNQFAEITVDFEPANGDADHEFVDATGDELPRHFANAVDDGVRAALADDEIPLSTPLRIVLRSARFHATDSTPRAFRTAGWLAVKQASEAARHARRQER